MLPCLLCKACHLVSRWMNLWLFGTCSFWSWICNELQIKMPWNVIQLIYSVVHHLFLSTPCSYLLEWWMEDMLLLAYNPVHIYRIIFRSCRMVPAWLHGFPVPKAITDFVHIGHAAMSLKEHNYLNHHILGPIAGHVGNHTILKPCPLSCRDHPACACI